LLNPPPVRRGGLRAAVVKDFGAAWAE
jgi:hypothetical protein